MNCFGDLLLVMTKREFVAYAWNCERMVPGFHKEFAELALREMRTASGLTRVCSRPTN